MKRDYDQAAKRSMELWNKGLSEEMCESVTGVNPIDHQHQCMVKLALWGCLLGGVAIGVILTGLKVVS